MTDPDEIQLSKLAKKILKTPHKNREESGPKKMDENKRKTRNRNKRERRNDD